MLQSVSGHGVGVDSMARCLSGATDPDCTLPSSTVLSNNGTLSFTGSWVGLELSMASLTQCCGHYNNTVCAGLP